MADMTYESAVKALRRADAAGNAEDARKLARIANRLKPGGEDSGGGQMMRQVNAGIAESVGGLVDFLNPFDEPHALNPFPNGTGSAHEGLTRGMEASGIDVAEGDPEGIVQNVARGTGAAAGAMIPVAKGAQVLRGASGTAGRLADDIYRGLTTRSGGAVEAAAGGVAAGAAEVAEDAGAPEWAQTSAALLAPLSIPASVSTARKALQVMPGGMAARSAIGSTQAAVAPYTKSGAREVARGRLQELAGGPERAERLAGNITSDNPLNLTPAQQTGDENMLALERMAAREDPNLSERLQVRADQGNRQARREVRDVGGEGGRVDDTRSFIEDRQRRFETNLRGMADQALERAEGRIRSLSAQNDESENARIVSREIDQALKRATDKETRLWDAVPRGAMVSTDNARSLAQTIVQQTPRAQRRDIPQVLRELLIDEGGFADRETVAEMHGLYSELRRVGRSAMAGDDKNENTARIASEVADAILKDLGAGGGQSQIGRAIDQARTYSAVLHQTFDQGAVGRLRRRTVTGDASVDPELSLRRTVGRTGPEGANAARQIETATESDQARFAIEDYIRDRFQTSAINPQGEFTNAGARKFIRDNQPLLQQYPDLREEILGAVANRESAEQVQRRVADIISRAKTSRRSALAAFLDGPPDRAINSVLNAQNPVRAARSLKNATRRDETGQALRGLKAAFADHLIAGASTTTGGRTMIDGNRLAGALDNDRLQPVLRTIFEPQELGRLRRISTELNRVQGARMADIGSSLSGAKANRVIEMAVRIAAARHGAQLGGDSGGSMQTAQMLSSRAKETVNRLTSDRASQLLADAVEDPALFRALLTDVGSPRMEKEAMPKLIPYLLGGAVGASQSAEE